MSRTAHFASQPAEMVGLVSCMGCRLVKTFRQFYDDGCDNCTFLDIREDQHRVAECTTGYFDGMMAIMRPNESWVARWMSHTQTKPGCYRYVRSP